MGVLNICSFFYNHVGEGGSGGARTLSCLWAGTAKNDIRTLNFRSDVIFHHHEKTPNDIQKRLLCDIKMSKMKKMTDNK